MIRWYRALPFRMRASVAATVIIAALASIGEGVAFFDQDDAVFGAALTAFVIAMGLAGVALSIAQNPFESVRDDGSSTPGAGGRWFLSLLLGVPAIVVAFVLGEVFFLAAFLSGALDDFSVVFAPLLIGVLGGATCMLIGVLAGALILWPLGVLVRTIVDRATGRAVHPVVPAIALLFLTMVAFAVLGALGSNAPDFVGTPRGRGLAQIIYLYTNYSGTPTQQVLAWIARPLLVVIVLEAVWIRRLQLHVRASR